MTVLGLCGSGFPGKWNELSLSGGFAPLKSYWTMNFSAVTHASRANVGRMLEPVRAIARIFRNAFRWRAGKADYERWSSAGGLEQWWDERTKTIAKQIPVGSRVIEFGAGRRQLEKFLPQDCSYVPSDIVDRGPGTVVCDLNSPSLPDITRLGCDTAVFGGVLEYVRDVPTVAHWLANSNVKTCVTSFDPVPAGLGLAGLWRETGRRTYYGYMNRLTEAKLLRAFEAAGFVCFNRQTWTNQIILCFRKQPK